MSLFDSFTDHFRLYRDSHDDYYINKTNRDCCNKNGHEMIYTDRWAKDKRAALCNIYKCNHCGLYDIQYYGR